MYCTKCGKEMRGAGNFCPGCGAPVKNAPQADGYQAQRAVYVPPGGAYGNVGQANIRRGFIDNFFYVLQNCFNFFGRASRREYWLFILAMIPACLMLGFVLGLTGLIDPSDARDERLIESFFGIAGAVLVLAVGVRRLHDVGKSGWWLLLQFVPLANLYLLYLFIKRGDAGDNIYGPDPLA